MKILFRLKLTSKVDGKKLNISVSWPRRVRHYSKLVNRRLSHLESEVRLSNNGARQSRIAGGESLLEILFSATDLIRQNIPFDEQDMWVDKNGVPSWVILPNRIPISWGYENYLTIAKYSKGREESYVRALERKRDSQQKSQKLRRKSKQSRI